MLALLTAIPANLLPPRHLKSSSAAGARASGSPRRYPLVAGGLEAGTACGDTCALGSRGVEVINESATEPRS